MSTPFSNIYAKFLSKVSDYSFVDMYQPDAEEIFHGYLISSITKFKKCKTDLSDRTNIQFNQTLTDEETEILAMLMIPEYLSPKLITGDLLKQTLSSKDFKMYSQANHLKELRELRDSVKQEVDKLIVSYTYNGNLEDLR